jgi:hypothetical protein
MCFGCWQSEMVLICGLDFLFYKLSMSLCRLLKTINQNHIHLRIKRKCRSGLLEFGALMKLDNFKGRKPKYVREKMSKLAKDTKLTEVDDKQADWKKKVQYQLQISSLQEEVANLKKLGTEKIKQNHNLDDNWEKRLSKIVKTVVQEKKKKVFKLVEKEFTDIGNETFEEVKLFLMG